MKKPARWLALLAVVLVAGIVGAIFSGLSRGRSTLAKYKAELRAKGEKLSAEELGYPRPPENSESLNRLLAAANKLGGMRIHPSTLELHPFTGPGRVQVVWAASQLVQRSTTGVRSNGNSVTWEELTAQYADATDITAELREAVQTPPRYFYNDPTNFFNAPRAPFVGIRNAAQWLAGDTMVALRARELDRAGQDIHALTRVTQFHREDNTLVCQMIRVAVAGLGLSVTWQALQADDWDAEQLAGMQRDWESVELADAFETGMLGERAFGEAAFASMRAAGSRERMRFVRFSAAAGPVQLRSPKDYFEAYIVMPYWAANADADELFFLQHHQRNLDSIRGFWNGAPWPKLNTELNAHQAELNKVFSSPLARVRYLLSSIAIPNSAKAAATCVRNETQRRLTVTAIALERFRLREGQYPTTLEALVPRFLAAPLIDPMNAKPLCYRLNADGTFTLYSVGEDGRDDGGDASPSVATGLTDMWSGRDAVWTVAESGKP